MEMIRKLQTKEWYKWVIVAACFLMVAITLGFCSSTRPLYLSAVTGALGMARSLFSISDSFRYVTSTIVNLFFGVLVVKFGARKLIAAGFLCLAGSMVVYSVAETLPLFYVAGILLGLGFSWTTTTMVGCVIDVWCKGSKGTIMGAVLAANGLGGAVAAQVVGPLISGSSDGFGYRTAYMVTALILLAVGLLVVAVFRNSPDGTKIAAPGKKKAKGATWSGVSFQECLRTPYFYVACVCVFFTGFALQGVNGVYKAHMNDVGIPDDFSTLVVSVHALTLAGCKFLTGWFYDKKGLRFTVILCDIAAVAMVLLLSMSAPTSFGMTCAMGYGIVSCLALPLETVMLPLIAASLFGEKDFVKVLGVFVSANSAGYALSAPLCNLVFDITGSYIFCFYAMGVLFVLVAVLFQLVLRAAKRRQSMAVEANT